MAFHNVLLEMRCYSQWVAWRYKSDNKGKATKVPVDPKNGNYASHSNPATWLDYPSAVYGVRKFRCDGVGFVFTDNDPFTGVDLDHCRDSETGQIEPWAEAVIRKLQGYTEISP